MHIANLNIWKRSEKSINTLNCGWCFARESADLTVEVPTLNHRSESAEVGGTKGCRGALLAPPMLPCLDFHSSCSPSTAANRCLPYLPSEIGQHCCGEVGWGREPLSFIQSVCFLRIYSVPGIMLNSDLESCGL